MRYQLPVSIIMIAGSMVAGGCCNQEVSMEEQNKATILRVHAEVAKGNIDVFDEVLAPDYVRHCQAMPPEFQEMRGGAKLKAFVKDFLAAVPDYSDSIGPIFTAGDMVAYVAVGTGTQTGEMTGFPATGKKFRLVNIIMQRFENGKVAETWITWDNVAMLAQLGLFPTAPTPVEEP